MKEKKKPIKILAVLPLFYPHKGGSQMYAEEIFAKMVAKHPEMEVDVLCYNTDKAKSFEKYRGLNIHRIPCLTILPGQFILPCPFALIKTLIKFRQNQYDFVNTHIRFFDPTWWVWIYAKLIGAKSIFTGHCADHPYHKNKFVQAAAKLVDLTIAKFSLRFYDLITVTNRCAGDFFKTTLGIKKYHLIYGGVDTSFFAPKPHQPRHPELVSGSLSSGSPRFRNKFGMTRVIPNTDRRVLSDEILITYMGRLIWTKGVTYLYEAAKDVLYTYNERAKGTPRTVIPSDPEHSGESRGSSEVEEPASPAGGLASGEHKPVFVLAGPGDLGKELKNQIKKDGLEDKIILTGYLSRSQVKDLLSISDIFIHPSHHNEGFPNTILEAGASGCFVIATDNAGTKEVVKNKETGLLIPQKDAQAIVNALLWAIDHPQECSQMAKKMRKMLVEKFDWKIISEKFYELLVASTA